MTDIPHLSDITSMPNLSEREILRRLETVVLPSECGLDSPRLASEQPPAVGVKAHGGLFHTEGNVIYPHRFCAPFNTRNKGI